MTPYFHKVEVLGPALTDSRQNPGHRMPHPRKPKMGSRKRVAGSFCICTLYSCSTFAQQLSLSTLRTEVAFRVKNMNLFSREYAINV